MVVSGSFFPSRGRCPAKTLEASLVFGVGLTKKTRDTFADFGTLVLPRRPLWVTAALLRDITMRTKGHQSYSFGRFGYGTTEC
jgi:hypothetical protein